MLEGLEDRAQRAARRRIEARGAQLAERLRAALPGGIVVEAAAGEVRLRGRNLARRFALEPALRWLTAALR